MSCLALCMLALTGVFSPVEEEEFLTWMKGRAMPVETLDWQKADLELGKLLKGKRIVYLGEADHFIHEKMDYRLILIRQLFKQGFRHIGMEMGKFDGERIDRYLETGEAPHLDRVAIFGYEGDKRTDRNDSIPGFTDKKHPEFDKKVTSESRWFIEQLRSLNEKLPPGETRLHYFGYDLSMRPDSGYVDAERLLGPYLNHPLAQKILKQLEPTVEGESRAVEIERLDELMNFLQTSVMTPKDLIGEEGATELEWAVRCMAESFRFIETARLPRGSRERQEGMVRREQYMSRYMDHLLEALPPDAKVILLGHNLHLSRDSESITAGEFQMWPSVGTHVAEKHPDEVYAIWLLFDHGRHGNTHLDDPVEEVKSIPGTLEQLMTHVGHAFFLPFHSNDPREAFLHEERLVVIMGQAGKTVPKKQVDAVFFLAEVHPPAIR